MSRTFQVQTRRTLRAGRAAIFDPVLARVEDPRGDILCTEIPLAPGGILPYHIRVISEHEGTSRLPLQKKKE